MSCAYTSSTVQYHDSIIVAYSPVFQCGDRVQMSTAIWSCHRSWHMHVAITVHVGHTSLSAAKEDGANQFPDVNSATAEVISRGAVVRGALCALHRHYDGLGIGSTTLLYGTVW